MSVRDRITELRRVRAKDLIPNPKNWRTHPKAQAEILSALLGEIGYADAILARETPQGLVIIDGHLRAETTPEAMVPVLVLDVTEQEADLLLATVDPLAAMATTAGAALRSLLAQITTSSDSINSLLSQLQSSVQIQPESALTEQNLETLRKKWGVEVGQLWTVPSQTMPGRAHRILCGSSLEERDITRLCPPGTAAYEGVLTDPPL